MIYQMIRTLPAIFTLCALSGLQAATFQLVSNLDNSFIVTPAVGTPGQPGYVAPVFSTTVEAPFVGSLTLSYDATNSLANGSYAWNSLTNLQLAVLFPGAGAGGANVTFDQTHLDFNPAGISIQVVDGNFFFTNSGAKGSGTSNSGSTFGGSANFINGIYLFTTQPLDTATRVGFGNYVVEYNALYQLRDTASGNPIYQGNYGNPTDNASAVPEPSALSLLVIGMAGLAALRRRKA